MTDNSEIQREIIPGGGVRLVSPTCTFTFERTRPGALYVSVTGYDRGQFGPLALDEIRSAIAREGKLELFVDAREATGIAVNVSDDWTRFFAANRGGLDRVHVLAATKSVELSVAVAQHFSRTGDLIEI